MNLALTGFGVWQRPQSSVWLEDCVSALGPALTSITRLEISDGLEKSVFGSFFFDFNIFIMPLIYYCFAWCLQKNRQAELIKLFVGSAHAYIQIVFRSCPNLQCLAIDNGWLIEDVKLLGEQCPRLTKLQLLQVYPDVWGLERCLLVLPHLTHVEIFYYHYIRSFINAFGNVAPSSSSTLTSLTFKIGSMFSMQG